MLEVIYFLLAVSNVLFWVSFVKAVRLFGTEDEQGSVFGYSEGIRAVAGLLINFAALGILGYYISSTCPLRYVLIFYGVVYVIMGVAMFFLLPKDNKRENVATSLKDYLNVLKVPGVWLVAILVLCAYSVQVAAEYTTTYLTTVFGMGAVIAGIVATIRSYGIGIFSAPIDPAGEDKNDAGKSDGASRVYGSGAGSHRDLSALCRFCRRRSDSAPGGVWKSALEGRKGGCG